jgi:hypothetical protein
MKLKLESLISRIRPDVTDALDTTTQLETLGYNRHRTRHEFAANNTFELGKALFSILPKQGFFPKLQATPIPYLRYLLIVLGILLSLGSSPPLSGFMILLAWSLVFSRLLGQATSESKKTYDRLFTLALLSGLLLMSLDHLINPKLPKDIALLLFWWNLNLSFWQRSKIYWLFSLLLLGMLSLIWPTLALLGLLAFSLLFLPKLNLPKASTWSYLKEHTGGLLLTILYALAQAYLLWHVITHAAPWWSVLILTGAILISEWLEHSFSHHLKVLLWSSKNREDYHARLFSSLGFWGQVALVVLFIAALMVLRGFKLIDLSMLNVALLAITIGSSFLLLRLEQLFFVAIGFAIAGLLVFLGFPLWPVMLGLLIIFLVGMMLIIMRVEASGISIL